MAEQKLLLGNVRGPQGEAGPNEVSTSTTTSGFEDGHVLYNNNGKVGAKKLGASDVGARPDNWMPTTEQVGAAPAKFIQSGSFNDIKTPGVYYLANAVTDKPADTGGLYVLQYVHDNAAVGLYCPVNGNEIYKIILPGTSYQQIYKFTGSLVG